MPEGNEVHRWAERHTVALAGRKLHVEGPNGRFKDSAALEGRRLERVLAVGKHLGYDFGADRILHVHLGRYGDWTEGQMPLPEVRGMLRLRMWRVGAKAVKGAAEPAKRHSWYSNDDGRSTLDPGAVDWLELRGPTDCSVYTQAKWDTLLQRLGPDPLNGDKPEAAFEKIGRAKKPIGVLLMEQDVMSGIGNIYRAELLFRARLSPYAMGADVPKATLRSIWNEAKPLLKAGMVDRRIVTTLPKDRPHRALTPPLKEEVHYVYRRKGKPCWICGTAVLKEDMAGRSLYWCPVCQV